MSDRELSRSSSDALRREHHRHQHHLRRGASGIAGFLQPAEAESAWWRRAGLSASLQREGKENTNNHTERVGDKGERARECTILTPSPPLSRLPSPRPRPHKVRHFGSLHSTTPTESPTPCPAPFHAPEKQSSVGGGILRVPPSDIGGSKRGLRNGNLVQQRPPRAFLLSHVEKASGRETRPNGEKPPLRQSTPALEEREDNPPSSSSLMAPPNFLSSGRRRSQGQRHLRLQPLRTRSTFLPPFRKAGGRPNGPSRAEGSGDERTKSSPSLARSFGAAKK